MGTTQDAEREWQDAEKEWQAGMAQSQAAIARTKTADEIVRETDELLGRRSVRDVIDVADTDRSRARSQGEPSGFDVLAREAGAATQAADEAVVDLTDPYAILRENTHNGGRRPEEQTQAQDAAAHDDGADAVDLTDAHAVLRQNKRNGGEQ
jgi:hypothetical protein